jgi:hypothetical protein
MIWLTPKPPARLHLRTSLSPWPRNRPGVAEFLAAQAWLKPLAASCAIAPYLLKARQQGLTGSIADSIARLRAHGIWLGAQVQAFALKEEAKLTL